MLFSQRIKLAKEYEEWIKSIPEAKDCALNVISFLHGKDLLRNIKEECVNPMLSVITRPIPPKWGY